MSSLQQKKYLRLIKFSMDLSLEVTRAFTKAKVLSGYHDSLEHFLSKHKHDIYHLWTPDRCCCCSQFVSLKSKQLLYKPQFDKMFIMTGPVNHGHLKKDRSSGNKVIQHCICNITVNTSCTLDKLDIVILCRIVRNCFSLQSDERLWLDSISKIRNELAHVEDISNFENGTLDYWWQQLEGSVLGLSNKVPGDYYYTAIQGYVNVLKKFELDSSDVQDVLDKLKSDNAKLKEDMRDEMNNLYLKKEDFENAKMESENQMRQLTESVVQGQAAAVSQASDLQKSITDVNTNLEMHETKFKCLSEGQSKMECKIDQLTIMMQALLRNPPTVSTEAANSARKSHNVECRVQGTDIDYDRAVTELKNEEPIEDETQTFKINSSNTGSILLELTCSPEVLKSETSLRAAIQNLIDRIIKAGNIDTSVPSILNIQLTFEGPLTKEEALVLSTVFSRTEDNQTVSVQNKTGEVYVGIDDRIAAASFSGKRPENMVCCENCNTRFRCENCILKDRQIFDLMEIKAQGKMTKYETERTYGKLYRLENEYIDWMNLHLENLKKEEKTLERDVANCRSLRTRMSEEKGKDKEGLLDTFKSGNILDTLNERYSNICKQLETKSQQVKYHQFALDEYLSKEVEKDHGLPEIYTKTRKDTDTKESQVEKEHDLTNDIEKSTSLEQVTDQDEVDKDHGVSDKTWIYTKMRHDTDTKESQVDKDHGVSGNTWIDTEMRNDTDTKESQVEKADDLTDDIGIGTTITQYTDEDEVVFNLMVEKDRDPTDYTKYSTWREYFPDEDEDDKKSDCLDDLKTLRESFNLNVYQVDDDFAEKIEINTKVGLHIDSEKSELHNSTTVHCLPDCKGVPSAMKQKLLTDRQLLWLGNKMILTEVYPLSLHLGMKHYNVDEITDEQKTTSMAKFYILRACREKNKRCNDFLKAMEMVEIDEHNMCEIFREKEEETDLPNQILNMNPSDEMLDKLSLRIGKEWMVLGLELGLEIETLEKIEWENPKNLGQIIRKMLYNWSYREEVTNIRYLLYALVRAGRNPELIREVLENCSSFPNITF